MVSSDYVEFARIRHAIRFKARGVKVLESAVSHFLGCSVEFIDKPRSFLHDSYGLDITENPRRGVYIFGRDESVILGRVYENEAVISAFALRLKAGNFVRLGRVLANMQGVLSYLLSRAWVFRFDVPIQDFGEPYLRLVIARYFSRGYYDYRKLLYLLDLFGKLSNTTFEGRPFTTGLIITRSGPAFAGRTNHPRSGQAFTLRKYNHLDVSTPVDKRFWYLADGNTSFFLCNKRLSVHSMFILPREAGLPSFVDGNTLGQTLRGGDALFRVVNAAEQSVVSSEALEFNYKETRWRIRDHARFFEIVTRTAGATPDVVQSVLYFALALARNRTSGLIWLPAVPERIEGTLLSQNQLTESPLNVTNVGQSRSILRCMSSDGATVISPTGDVLWFGCIVDLAKVKISGVRGTGETVASLLAENGVAIKISQDGAVKVFHDPRAPAVLF